MQSGKFQNVLENLKTGDSRRDGRSGIKSYQ